MTLRKLPPLVGQGESTQGLRNLEPAGLEDPWRIKPHALRDKVFLELKREPRNTIHFIYCRQNKPITDSHLSHSTNDTRASLPGFFLKVSLCWGKTGLKCQCLPRRSHLILVASEEASIMHHCTCQSTSLFKRLFWEITKARTFLISIALIIKRQQWTCIGLGKWSQLTL